MRQCFLASCEGKKHLLVQLKILSGNQIQQHFKVRKKLQLVSEVDHSPTATSSISLQKVFTWKWINLNPNSLKITWWTLGIHSKKQQQHYFWERKLTKNLIKRATLYFWTKFCSLYPMAATQSTEQWTLGSLCAIFLKHIY